MVSGMQLCLTYRDDVVDGMMGWHVGTTASNAALGSAGRSIVGNDRLLRRNRMECLKS